MFLVISNVFKEKWNNVQLQKNKINFNFKSNDIEYLFITESS